MGEDVTDAAPGGDGEAATGDGSLPAGGTSRSVARVGGLLGIGGLVAWWLRRRCGCCAVGPTSWDAAPTWSTDGTMTNVGAFNAFVAAHEPCWRHYPATAAQVVVGIDVGGGEPTAAITLDQGPGAGSGETDVTIVRDVEGDDSVAAERFMLTFGDEATIGGTTGGHRLLFATRSFRCHPGRGHEDWGTTPCL